MATYNLPVAIDDIIEAAKQTGWAKLGRGCLFYDY